MFTERGAPRFARKHVESTLDVSPRTKPVGEPAEEYAPPMSENKERQMIYGAFSPLPGPQKKEDEL